MDQSLIPRRDKVALPAKLLLAGCLAIVAAYHFCRVFDLGHRSYGEGPILALTERLESGPISARWRTDPPYTLSCYGPAYYWASGGVARLGGWRHSIIPGRLVSLGAALFVALLLAIAAGSRTKNAELGGLAALMFLVSTPVVEWLPFARVDMLALAGAAVAYLTIDNRRGAWLSALAVAAGSLAKPTVALAAVPISLHLLACRRYRTAIGFASLTTVLGGMAWALAQRASHGYFLSAVLSGNRNPLSLWRGYRFGYEFLASPLGVGACLTAVNLWIASREKFRRSLFSLGFVVSLAISTVLVCKRGSDLNYYLEP
ncbi:MAG TPA: glycosyltransferase 87 family protein, partial [Pirellulales bacterium]|nr:glycosyltransferase 87 family protein [Pirellulales bacterium]